jgi:hypothetical protein
MSSFEIKIGREPPNGDSGNGSLVESYLFNHNSSHRAQWMKMCLNLAPHSQIQPQPQLQTEKKKEVHRKNLELSQIKAHRGWTKVPWMSIAQNDDGNLEKSPPQKRRRTQANLSSLEMLFTLFETTCCRRMRATRLLSIVFEKVKLRHMFGVWIETQFHIQLFPFEGLPYTQGLHKPASWQRRFAEKLSKVHVTVTSHLQHIVQ